MTDIPNETIIYRDTSHQKAMQLRHISIFGSDKKVLRYFYNQRREMDFQDCRLKVREQDQKVHKFVNRASLKS